MLLAGQVLVLVRGETQAQVNLAPVLLFPGVGFLQVPPATDSAGREVLHGYLDTAKQLVVYFTRSGVKSLLDELPQPSAVLDLVDLVQLLVDALLRVEVPNIQPHTVLIHTVDVSEED